MKKFIFSTFAGLQTYSRQLYYQMNSFTGIFQKHLKPSMLPPCIDLSPPPHVHNTCGKPCSIKCNSFILKCFIQFTCTNLDGSQREGIIFLICFRKRGYMERRGFLQKKGSFNPGGNCVKNIAFISPFSRNCSFFITAFL